MNKIPSEVGEYKNAGNPIEDFPYRRHYMPDFMDMYRNLVLTICTPPVEWGPSDGYMNVIRRRFPEDYESVDSLTDWFAEPVRILCREKSRRSPAEAWASLNIRDEKDIHILREKVYNLERGCNLFNTVLGGIILKKFNAKHVLDCAAGWGDRLIASHAAGCSSYTGWDTNPGLQDVYNNISKKLSDNGQSLDFNVYLEPFENQGALFSEGGALHQSFDMALCSPPFYDKELYSGPLTSTTLYKTKQEWISSYYSPTLINIANGLRPGGYFAAYISDGWMENITSRTMENIGFFYLGKIGFIQEFGKKGRIRNTYIWQKNKYAGHIPNRKRINYIAPYPFIFK